jgi:anti-sigma regulatory factor (Ser/Thr protein kinase)
VTDGPAEPERLCERIIRRTVGSDHPHDDVTLVVVQASLTLGETLEVELIGEQAALAAFRQGLRRWLEEAGAAADEVQDVVMAVNEACQNAIEHAYGLAPEPFDVKLTCDDGSVAVVVRDRGGWRDGRSDDRGRGLPLMRALMDEVDIEQRPTGSTVTLRRTLRSAQREPATTA